MKKGFDSLRILQIVGIVVIALLVYWLFFSRPNGKTLEDKLTSKYDDIPAGKNKSYYSGFEDGLDYVKSHFENFCRDNNLGFDYYYEGMIDGYKEGYLDAINKKAPKYEVKP